MRSQVGEYKFKLKEILQHTTGDDISDSGGDICILYVYYSRDAIWNRREGITLNEIKKLCVVHLPIMLEKDARVLNGIWGLSSTPPNSYTRFSASCSRAFKWFPSESAVLSANIYERNWKTIEIELFKCITNFCWIWGLFDF